MAVSDPLQELIGACGVQVSDDVSKPLLPAPQELQAHLAFREGSQPTQVADDAEALGQLDVGAQALQQLGEHGPGGALGLRVETLDNGQPAAWEQGRVELRCKRGVSALT